MNIPDEAVESAYDAAHYDVKELGWDEVAKIVKAAAPQLLAPLLELAAEWDAVADVFPRSAVGIFAKSHANRLREVLGQELGGVRV